MDREIFYLIWDVEDLQFAAKEAANSGVPLDITLNWTRKRYAKGYARKAV